ncbi:hypothetical protein [Rhizomonospora bruguierae]|uniref:hypothetical protein n=1 Tax=Rhizomonospora bruguierae TaxID=1581705 RepID=UPI001BCA9AFC|nr:hypothetical protein [Micromonospora sp. NBRC 107566]
MDYLNDPFADLPPELDRIIDAVLMGDTAAEAQAEADYRAAQNRWREEAEAAERVFWRSAAPADCDEF